MTAILNYNYAVRKLFIPVFPPGFLLQPGWYNQDLPGRRLLGTGSNADGAGMRHVSTWHGKVFEQFIDGESGCAQQNPVTELAAVLLIVDPNWLRIT